MKKINNYKIITINVPGYRMKPEGTII